MAPVDPFYPSGKRLRRAIQLYNQLVDLQAEYLASVELEWHTTGPNDEGLYTHIRQPNPQIPEQFEDQVADCLHNCRASLDFLLYECAQIRGVKSRQIAFPFCASPEDLEVVLSDRNRKLKQIGPDVVDLIRQQRPYSGGNEVLKALHDLDIVAKHRHLIEISVSTPAMLGPTMQVLLAGRYLSQGQSPAAAVVNYPWKVINMDPSYNSEPENFIDLGPLVKLLVFRPGAPLHGKRVLWNLDLMLHEVERVRHAFIAAM